MKTYQQFILEARDPKSDYLKKIEQNVKRGKGVKLQLSKTPSDTVRIHGMHVNPEDQGRGKGSRTMEIVKGLIKNSRNWQTTPPLKGASLSASAEPGRERDLHRFYTKKHGFKRTDRDSDTYTWSPQ